MDESGYLSFDIYDNVVGLVLTEGREGWQGEPFYASKSMLKLIDKPDRGQQDVRDIMEELVDYFLIVAGVVSLVDEVVKQLPYKE